MIIKIISASNDAYDQFSLGALYKRLKFIITGITNFKTLDRFSREIKATKFSKVLQRKPSVFGFIAWPYINNEWSLQERFNRIATHYKIIGNYPAIISEIIDKPKCLVDLNSFSKGLKVYVDKADWFIREGELVLTLFQDELRVVSVPIIFSYHRNASCIMIGAIQGIHKGISSNDSLEIFKQISKDLHGLRPRSVMIEVIKSIGRQLDIETILAISDEFHQKRHPYFGLATSSDQSIKTKYDNVWLEHGGVYRDGGFYSIPLEPRLKALSDVKAKKRAMYRRRNELISSISHKISEVF